MCVNGCEWVCECVTLCVYASVCVCVSAYFAIENETKPCETRTFLFARKISACPNLFTSVYNAYVCVCVCMKKKHTPTHKHTFIEQYAIQAFPHTTCKTS